MPHDAQTEICVRAQTQRNLAYKKEVKKLYAFISISRLLELRFSKNFYTKLYFLHFCEIGTTKKTNNKIKRNKTEKRKKQPLNKQGPTQHNTTQSKGV